MQVFWFSLRPVTAENKDLGLFHPKVEDSTDVRVVLVNINIRSKCFSSKAFSNESETHLLLGV